MIAAPVLALCFALAPAQVAIEAEEHVGDRYNVEARGDQNHPHLAVARDVALAVYSDLETASIHGAILDASGAVVDDTAFRIAKNASAAGVSTDGDVFLVVWTPVRGDSAVYGTRVLFNGAVLDAEPILIAENATSPSVAFNGAGFAVSYTVDWKIHVVQVNAAGEVLEQAHVELPCAGLCGYSSIAAGIGGHFLAWFDPSRVQVEGVRLDASFNELDEPPILLFDHFNGAPQVVFAGSSYLITFEGPSAIEGALVSFDGTTILRELDLDGPALTSRSPAPAGVAGELRVAFVRPRAIEQATVLESGTSTAIRVFADPASRADHLALAAFDGRALAVWAESEERIRAKREDWPETSTVSSTANAQTTPAIAQSRFQTLTVWVDEGVLRANIMNQNFDLPSTPGADILRVRAVHAQDQFYVFWFEEGESVRYARISTGGTLIDTKPFATRAANPFDVATDGTELAILYPYAGTMHLDFIDPQPGRSSQMFGELAREPAKSDVALARGPDTWAGIWSSCDPIGLCTHRAIVLDESGVPIDQPVLVDRATGPGVAVAFNGTTYTLVYELAYRLVSRGLEPIDGNFIPGTELVFCGSDCSAPRAIFDGYRAAVAWTERRAGALHLFMETFPEPIEDPDTAISELETSEPAFASTATPGRVWIAYRRFAPRSPFDTDRVYRRTVYFGSAADDAGISDSGLEPSDSGNSADAGDGGVEGARDAGISGLGGLEEAESGCGCDASSRTPRSPVSMAIALAIGLILARRRWHAARAA